MGKAQTYLPTGIFSQAHTATVSQRDKVNTSGRMEASTSANSRMGSRTEGANGESDSMHRTATCMRDSTKMIRKTAWVSSPGKVETSTRVATKMTRGTDMERCIGKMAHAIRANGKAESSTVLGGCSSLMDG